MIKEQQQIIDEAYENYVNKTNEDIFKSDITLPVSYYPIYKDKFINKCKTDSEFSEEWGLKIEERELTEGERVKLYYEKHNIGRVGSKITKFVLDYDNIPTKLISLTYNENTIESYE